MKAFYCHHFVLPLPEGHAFPMAKYARLHARVAAMAVASTDIAPIILGQEKIMI